MIQQGQQSSPGVLPVAGQNPISSTAMQPPPPRMPGMQGSARMSPSKRLEYDAYVQSRLQQMGQGIPPRGMPRPPGMPAQPRMAIVVGIFTSQPLTTVSCISLTLMRKA